MSSSIFNFTLGIGSSLIFIKSEPKVLVLNDRIIYWRYNLLRKQHKHEFGIVIAPNLKENNLLFIINPERHNHGEHDHHLHSVRYRF